MAKFFKSKKSSAKKSADVPATVNAAGELQPNSSLAVENVEEKYFSKSLSYLKEEKNKLRIEEERLVQSEAELQVAYLNLIEERKRVSQEQQEALSVFNGASLECFEKELTSSISESSGEDGVPKDGEAVDLFEQRKTDLRNMKNIENEKDALCEELDNKIFESAENLNAIHNEIERIRKTREEIENAIQTAGNEEDEQSSDDGPPKKKKGLLSFNAHRRVASKVRWVNFLNVSTYLKNDCEIEYGVVKLIVNYCIAFVAIALIGLLYSLKLPYVLFLCLTYFVFGPSLVYFSHRKKYEKKKFSTAVRYIEQMIYSFTHHSKLLNSLEETRDLMSGKVCDAIDYAISTLRYGKSKGDLYKDALQEIEKIFPCARVKNLHELLIDVERDGGECNAALDIMLEDVREWDIRTNNFQQEQTVKGISMIVSILMSLGVCFFMTNILPDDMGGDITGFGLYQVISTVSLIIMFFIYRFSARKLTSSWVNDDLGENKARIKADYKKVKAYAENPSGKIKPVLAMTRMQTAMDKAFPRWVTRFALLASSKPIPVALSNSVDKAPLVMKEELNDLYRNLESDPSSIKPYAEFFKDFDMPQVRSMMMMVYSLASTDAQNVEKHILSIVKRNHLLQATAEKIEFDEKMGMFTLFSTLPMLIACVIMMIDVAMILLNMMNTVM